MSDAKNLRDLSESWRRDPRDEYRLHPASKGGQNPPNESTARPPAPTGSGRSEGEGKTDSKGC